MSTRHRKTLCKISACLCTWAWVSAFALAAPIAAQARVYDIVENDTVDFDFSTRRGLRLRFREPKIALRIGGRLHYDTAFTDDDVTQFQRSKSGFRRGRLYLSGKIYDDFAFKVDREFAPARRGWRNVWGRLRLRKGLSLKVGNLVAPLGMENIVASNFSTFMERSASANLAPSFQTGVLLSAKGRFGDRNTRHRWTMSAGWMMQPLGRARDDLHSTKHNSFVSRVTYAPLAKKRRVIHIGAAVEVRDVRGNRRYRISGRPGSALDRSLLRTGGIRDVDTAITFGLEGAGIYGPFTLQGEYTRTSLDRTNGRKNLVFDGGYIQASYVLTGERRRYNRSSGVIGGVNPKSVWGAVEIGLRFNTLDLNDGTVNGGKMDSWTVGVNWYLRENLRLMFNYVAVNARIGNPRQSDRPKIAEGRLQLFF